MHEADAHLSDWTLDLLAEGSLSHAERSQAEAHLRACALCAGELEAARAVMAALSSLPRFEPSPRFAEGVMARVAIQPLPAPAPERARRWLPRTARGWMAVGVLSLAPMATLAALLAWVLSHPLVSPGALLGLSGRWVRDTGWSLLARAAEALVRSGLWQWGADTFRGVGALSPQQLAAAALLVAIAVPASGWAMARLLRTPMGGMTHAH